MNRTLPFVLSCALVAAACSDDEGDNTGAGDAADQAGDSSDGADLGDADQGAGVADATDQGEDATPDLIADQGDAAADQSGDAVADLGDDGAVDGSDDRDDQGSGDTGSDASVCDGECAAGTPSGGTNSATTNAQQVAIVGVDFTNDRVVLENVSGDALTLNNWWLCQGPGQYGPLPTIVFADDGDRVVVDLLGTGTNTNDEVFAGLGATFNLGANDNLALYRTNANFSSNLNIEAYVQWSQGGVPLDGRESTASGVGLWTADSPVSVCATNNGIVASGDVTNPANWADAADPESCLFGVE